MNRILLLTITFLISGITFGQNIPELKLTRDSVEPIIVKTDSLTKPEIYKKALNWVQETYKNPDKVLVIEKDNKLAEELKNKYSNNIQIINDDVLDVNESNLFKEKDERENSMKEDSCIIILLCNKIANNNIYNSLEKIKLILLLKYSIYA